MAALAWASAVFSTSFRITMYLFLRVIPFKYILMSIPTFYVLHLSTLLLLPVNGPVQSQANGVPNGHDVSSKDGTLVAPTHKKRTRVDALRALLFSFPSTSKSIRIITILINTALWLPLGEFILHPVFEDAKDVIFTRVGAVYPDSARLVVRYPHANETDATVRILWRQVPVNGEDPWSIGPTISLTAAKDWVNTAPLDGLWPSTSYEYIVSDIEGNKLPYPAEPIQFHTFPDPRLPAGSHFRFLASSCTTPNFPYQPRKGMRIKGFDLLADYLWPSRALPADVISATLEALNITDSAAESNSALEKYLPTDLEPPAEFMVFLGDFIYADVPYYFGDDTELYRRLYRRNYASDSFRKVYEHLPIFHTYDDHEIINNYMGAGNDSTPPFASASDAFRLYNADANYDALEPDQYYYEFRYADTAFFVMDTRRYRSDIDKTDVVSRTMLGDKQLSALYDWLGKVNNTATFKFIVSSVPFTSLWQHDAQQDSWAGYPYEKMSLLDALHSVPNVVIISGDRHEFAAVKFNAEGGGHNVLEVSTSPLSMFYVPFIRTLRMASENVIKVAKQVVSVVEGEPSTHSIEEEEVPQEQVLRYIAEGNYKWSSFEVDTRDLQHPIVKLEVMIDGLPAYRLQIEGKSVELHSSSAIDLPSIVPSGIMNVLDKFGLKPNRWF